MALSNTAVPKYYGMFRDAVIRGEIPVCKEISMEMNRIDDLIANPGVYYDDQAVEGWIAYCESELTLTDGSDLSLLDSFKLWGEQIFGWYYFVERSVYQPNPDGHGGHYVRKNVKKRLINKQYLIVARGAAKSMYGSTLQGYFLNVDTSTTHQITTAPTMKQAEEVMSPLRTAITRSRGPLFQFLTEGSLQNTTGSKANRTKLASTKKGVENFLTGSLLEVRPMSINKLQGLQIKVATVDEWLSGDIREDVIGAIEQGASKVNDYIIVAISSEGTVRNGSGDTIKMELMDILNPGAFIDSMLKHGEMSDDEAIIYTGMPLCLSHSAESKDEPKEEEKKKDSKEDKPAEDKEEKKDDEETIADVIDSMSEKQQNVMYALIAQALEGEPEKESKDDSDNKSESNKEDKTMKHNVFDNDQQKKTEVLSHADQASIISMAKSNSVGSLRTAMDIYAEQNPDSVLAHGIDGIETLFPEYKDVRPGAPELLTTDQGWVNEVLKKVHKSPISRIRTRQADLRNIEALRAKGYKKGAQKGYVGNIQLLHRTTDPQTVYVKSKLDRDDIIDIQDFDVVQYLYGIDRMNLNEELATAIMIGDGREVGADGKIAEDKIRPIWLDDELYTIHADVDIAGMKATLQGTNTSANFGENYIYAEAVIQSLLYAREKYKGSGTPDFYCTPHLVNVMLLARDLNGRRIYDKVSDLAAALNVGQIITAEQFEGKTRTTTDSKTKKLLGLMVNLADYSLGATKGGEITHFTDFDIDFNQEKSLLETRCSGANTRVMSAIALEEDVTATIGG